jgi:hypothetical protein
MKKVLVLSAVIAASLIATKGYSQVYVNARVGFRVPHVRVVAAAPVVYGQAYAPAPAPVYDEYAPAPVYQEGYAPDAAICEADFPGFAYYDYPAWEGHYRDRFYYAHYRPVFEREHSAYFDRGRFDRGRFENDRGRFENNRGRFENNRGRVENDRGRFESNRGRTENTRGRVENNRGRSENSRGYAGNERGGNRGRR